MKYIFVLPKFTNTLSTLLFNIAIQATIIDLADMRSPDGLESTVCVFIPICCIYINNSDLNIEEESLLKNVLMTLFQVTSATLYSQLEPLSDLRFTSLNQITSIT